MAVGLAALAPPAAAHGFERALEPVLDGVEPSVSGVTVEVRTVVAPALFVRNDGRRPLEVIGSDGRPFVRLGPRGVEANVSSPDLYRSNAPVAGAPIPTLAKPDASPIWVRVAREPAWSWFEHRIDPLRARAGDRWAIPARLGGRELRFTGRWKSAVVRGVFRTVVERIRPRAEGVSVEALDEGPALLVQNATGRLLELLDENDRPFLRVSRTGVELVQPGGSWARMGTTPAWAWLERRAGWESATPPARLRDAAEAVRLRGWSVRGRLDGRPLTISGRVEWLPVGAHHAPPAQSRSGVLILVAASAPLVLGALILVTRRRPRRQAPSGTRRTAP